MFRVQLFLLLALVGLTAAACGGGSDAKSMPADAAATVGDLTITKNRIALLMGQAQLTYSKQKVTFPKGGSRAYRGLRGRAVAYLVVGAMYEAKAADEGIEASDAEVKAAIEAQRREFGKTRAAQEKKMKEEGLTEGELESQARLRAIEQEVQKRVYAGVKVTDADVRQYYEENKSHFTIPENRVIRQILVRTKKLASRLRDMARSGSDFAALAHRYSLDRPTAKVGGKIAITKGQTSPAFDKVAFSIATGKISEPIVTQYGWQILQAITPVRLAVVTPLAKVASDLRRQLLETRRQKALADWQLEAKHEFCKGKIHYAAGYRPAPDDSPCNPYTRAAPSTG